MAAGNSSHLSYYNISNGKICKTVQSPTATSKERTNKNGRVVNEEFYDYIEGRITDIQTRENDYGKNWLISMSDSEGDYVLQMPYSSGYSAAFLKTLPNIDLDQQVKLTPKLTIEGEKKKTVLFVSQKGKALKFFYTKDTPNRIPQLEQKKVKGKMVWDDSEIMFFLEEMVKNEILPQLGRSMHSEPIEDNNNSENVPF